VLACCVLSTEDVFTTTGKCVRKIVLECKFNPALVKNIFYSRFDIVGEGSTMADIVEALLGKLSIALLAFGISLCVTEEDFRITDIKPRVL